MEVEVFDACPLDSILKCLTEATELLSFGIRKDQHGINTAYPGVLSHEGEGLPREGDCAPLPILGFVEGQGATF